MKLLGTFRCAIAAATIAVTAVPTLAQDKSPPATAEKVRTEITEAMDAIARYSEQKRDEALVDVRDALTKLDAEIARHEQVLRENWAEMSDAARENARTRVQELREARNELGERYGALQAGAKDAWEELKTGFANAWVAFSKKWNAPDNKDQAK